jgi:small redox-active disulfide protein 2
MSKKKGLFGGMFRKKQKDGCCDMEIIEERDSCCNPEVVKEPECDCGGVCNPGTASESTEASAPSATDGKVVIKVVGTGCTKCNTLTENATQAANELGIDFELIKISDMMEIAATGVMQTPGLIINDKIVSTGKVPKIEEIKTLLLKIE